MNTDKNLNNEQRKQFCLKKSVALILASMVATAMTSAASNVALSQAAPPDDGFSPLLLLFALFFAGVLLVLVGVGIVIGLACLASAAVFVALGIISLSALVAIFRRRFSAGLRALHYQILGLMGLPCGIGASWLGSLIFSVHTKPAYILTIGAVTGIVAGIAFAFILDRFFRFACRRLMPASGWRVSN